MKMLMKEWKLCMHPTGYIMLLCTALILVPGYPYGVSCFYMGLAIYFICLTARENHDATYTLTLPVSRGDAVRGRILFCAALEVIDLLLIALFILIKQLIGNMPNPAGLDAGVALIGEAMILFTIFNMIFFPLYYWDINKPGKAFGIAAVAVFLWIILEVVGTYTIPFLRDILDQPDPQYMGDKLLFTLGGLALFLGGTALSIQRSAKKFEEVDLSL
ncbi:MAG: ABC-2 transporter permease [Clostridia bacterium]|nr:ABC-2 transporter permease [Clostridia bacterium]